MDEKILRKIKRCLALAKSSNPHEAAIALRQAQALMEKHGISSDQVSASDVDAFESAAGSGQTPPTYVAALASMVARAFGAEAVYRRRYNPFDSSPWQGYIEFFGVGSVAEISGYAFEVLRRQLKKDRTAYIATLNKRLKRATKIRRGDLYAEGWIHAVNHKITTHKRTNEEQRALDAYREQRHKNLTDLKTRNAADKARRHDDGALTQGFADGKKVEFHQGVSGPAAPKRIGQGG